MAEDFTLEFAALSDTGCVRANNEDAVRIAPDYGFAVLADGMGGYNAGEVASHMAVDGIRAGLIHWFQDAPGLPENQRDVPAVLSVLGICMDEANHAILDDASTQPDHAGMGTTLVAALAYRGQLLIGHLGDSRLYRWRGGALAQITRDHSVLQEQVDAGLIMPTQAAALRHQDLLTRGLGVERTVTPDLQTTPLQKGDIYLLCSDGLTDMASDGEIAAVLGNGLSLPDIAQALIGQANANGGIDNVTVALIRVLAAPISGQD